MTQSFISAVICCFVLSFFVFVSVLFWGGWGGGGVGWLVVFVSMIFWGVAGWGGGLFVFVSLSVLFAGWGWGGVCFYVFSFVFLFCLFVCCCCCCCFLGGVVCLFVFPFCSSAGRKSGPFVWLKGTELERALCVGVGSLVSFGQVFFLLLIVLHLPASHHPTPHPPPHPHFPTPVPGYFPPTSCFCLTSYLPLVSSQLPSFRFVCLQA